MAIGENTRQILLGRLAKSHSLPEIEYCQELWVQTHGYKAMGFIGLMSQLAFDRQSFFIQSHHANMKAQIENKLASEHLLLLRRAIITEETSEILDVFSDLTLEIFPVYGPQQAVGLFLLSPLVTKVLTPKDRLHLAQDLYIIQQALFSEYFSRKIPPIKLTTREAEVLSWVAQGKSNTVIAEILGVSHHTIDNYLRRAYAKIGVNNRTLAAVKAISLGLTHT